MAARVTHRGILTMSGARGEFPEVFQALQTCMRSFDFGTAFASRSGSFAQDDKHFGFRLWNYQCGKVFGLAGILFSGG